MDQHRVSESLLPAVTAVVAVGLLVWWLAVPGADADVRQAGQDGGPEAVAGGQDGQEFVVGAPERGAGTPGTASGSWPGFRGPQRDGIADDGTRLARSWPPEGPPRRWQIDLGEGYAGDAVSQGCVYVLDYDVQASADTMRCLSLDTGLPIWTNRYPVLLTRNHGLSRTVPIVVGDCVISFGPRCHVVAWDANTGQCRWSIDLVKDHGATVPRWYAGQCPLIDQERLILAPCGPSLLMAVDYRTGQVIWQSPNPRLADDARFSDAHAVAGSSLLRVLWQWRSSRRGRG